MNTEVPIHRYADGAWTTMGPRLPVPASTPRQTTELTRLLAEWLHQVGDGWPSGAYWVEVDGVPSIEVDR